MTHVEELIGVITDPPGSHSNHVDESSETDPTPSDITLTVHRRIDIGDVHLCESAFKLTWIKLTHVYTTTDMNRTGYNDEPRTPTMKHVQTLVCKPRQFGEHVILPSQPYDQRNIGVCKPSSMMSLPVDITVGAEEYKEEV